MARYRTTMAELLKKVHEDGHEDVSSSKRMCQTIIEDATQIRTKLDSMSAEDKLDTWWTNKLAKSADNLNSARDYIMNPIEESLELDEGRMKTIYTMQQQGKSAAEIAKYMKLPVKTIKDILGESNLRYSVKFSYSKGGKIANAFYQSKDEAEKFVKSVIAKGGKAIMTTEEDELEESLDEFTTSQLNTLKKSYAGMKGKTISPEKATALSKHLDKLDLLSLRQLNKEKIPFLSTLARNKIYRKTGKFEEVEQPEKEKKEAENKDSVIATLKDQIAMLKQKLENEKNKAVKPEPNPETGEVPLTIGLANKLLKDKEMKKEDVQEADLTKPQIKKVHKMADELPKKDFKDRYGKEKGDAVRYATATNIVKKKLGIEGKDMKNEEMRLRVEAIAGLKKKAEKSGMPYSILKKVYDRGMAAWKGGHRPGASQHQWAFARVNSFVTKSSGTWGGADKDLAAKVRGSK